jgi:hypothetical protein
MIGTRIRRALQCSSAVVAALTGIALMPAVAHANGGLNADNGTLYNGCHNYSASFDLDYPGASSWEIDVSAYTPNGDYSDGFYESGAGSSGSGTRSVYICDYEGAGWYDLEGEVTYYDDWGDYLDSETLYGDMHLSKMATDTELRVNDRTPRYYSTVKFTVTSWQDKWPGWRRNNYDAVVLYARCGAEDWRRVRGTKTDTDQYGKAVIRLVYDVHSRCRVQAYTLPADDAKGSWSPVVRLRPAGSARMVAARQSGSVPGLG